MSFLPLRSYTQFDTPTRFCIPESLIVSLLLNFLTGLPHFFTSALLDSPVFTSFLPQRKLSADRLLETNVIKIRSNALFMV